MLMAAELVRKVMGRRYNTCAGEYVVYMPNKQSAEKRGSQLWRERSDHRYRGWDQ